MPDLDKYVVALEAETAKYERGLRRAQNRLDRFHKQQKSVLTGIQTGFVRFAAKVGATVASIQFGKKLIDVARETGVLKAQLTTATGSVENAQKAFAALEKFAARTPFALEQSVNAFIRLKNLGLTPSERALESYGNTASSMGKSVMQFVEAVADASVGEFERLKEFGIKASKEGDRVTFRFKGNTTEIGNSAAEIEEFLIGLGETDFAGGMQRQADTLEGAISNLGDTWDQTFRVINDNGIGQQFIDSVKNAEDALGDFNDALDIYLTKGETVSTLSNALVWVFEKMAWIGFRTAGTFELLGNALGGLAAAAQQALSGEFSDARATLDLIEVKAAEINARVEASIAALQGFTPSGGGAPETGGDALAGFGSVAGPETADPVGEIDYDKLLAEQQKFYADYNDAAVFGMIEQQAEIAARIEKDYVESFENIREAWSDTLVANMIQSAESGFDSILESWGRMLQQMLARAIASRVFDLFSSTSFGSGVVSFFGGGRAEGGPVSTGKGYIVGERGPEWFFPRTNGTIVPNGGGGAMTINVSAPNAAPNVVPMIEQAVTRAVAIADQHRLEARRRGQ